MSSKYTMPANSKVFMTQKGVFIAHEKDDILGRGTYGVVYRAHLKTDVNVKKAIKIFSPDTMDEAEGIPSTTLREINALKTIVHPNVMTAEEVVIPETRSSTDMFFVMELCKGTLKDKVIELIKEHLNNDPAWINPTPDMQLPKAYVLEAKVIAWQLLNSLAVVHSRGVMHRDLKPVNILWGYDDLLKLADFGLARFVRGNQNSDHTVLQQTGEVQTMWYRAPEVLLGDEKYGLLVDDWSLGCVLAELFRFRMTSAGRMEPAPLFQGRSDIGTLMIIFETLGTPQPKAFPSQEYLGRLKYWNDEFPQWKTPTIQTRLPLMDPLGHQVIEALLKTSPLERKAARFLLNHPWFDDVKPALKKFVPWYRGFEEEYKRMLAVDRLPLPRTIKAMNQSAAAQKLDHFRKPPQEGQTSTAVSAPTDPASLSDRENVPPPAHPLANGASAATGIPSASQPAASASQTALPQSRLDDDDTRMSQPSSPSEKRVLLGSSHNQQTAGPMQDLPLKSSAEKSPSQDENNAGPPHVADRGPETKSRRHYEHQLQSKHAPMKPSVGPHRKVAAPTSTVHKVQAKTTSSSSIRQQPTVHKKSGARAQPSAGRVASRAKSPHRVGTVGFPKVASQKGISPRQQQLPFLAAHSGANPDELHVPARRQAKAPPVRSVGPRTRSVTAAVAATSSGGK